MIRGKAKLHKGTDVWICEDCNLEWEKKREESAP
jgi:hypothetical protein